MPVDSRAEFQKHWETYSGTLEENSGPFASQRQAWKQLLLDYEQYLDNQGVQLSETFYLQPR